MTSTILFDTRTGLEYETTTERVFGECTWHAHPITEKSELDKNPRAPVSIDELVGSRYTVPLFEILKTEPSTPFGAVMIERIYQLSFILASLGWVHTRSEDEGILNRIKRPDLYAAIKADQTLFNTINKEAASIPLITSDGKGTGKYGPAAFCFTRTLGEMRNIVQSLKMNTSFKSRVFANTVSDEQRKMLGDFFVDTTIARDSVRPRTVDCFNRVMPLPIGHVVSWLKLPLGALDRGRGDIKTIRGKRRYAIVRPEYDYDIGVGRSDGYGNDRDPINNWGVHAGRYLCCGLDTSSPGCLIDTYATGDPKPKRYRLGVNPTSFWTNMASAAFVPDISASWDAKRIERGTAFMQRQKYDELDRRIRELFEGLRDPILAGVVAMDDDPVSPLEFYQALGHEACNNLIKLFTLVAEYNAFHCAGRERATLPRTPIDWIAHFERELFDIGASLFPRLSRGYLNVLAESALRAVPTPNGSRLVFSPVTTAALAVEVARIVAPAAPPPPPLVKGRGAKGAVKGPGVGRGRGAAKGLGGGGPPPLPVIDPKVTDILNKVEDEVNKAVLNVANPLASGWKDNMILAIQKARTPFTDEALANVVAATIGDRIDLLGDQSFAQVSKILLDLVSKKEDFLPGVADDLRDNRITPIAIWDDKTTDLLNTLVSILGNASILPSDKIALITDLPTTFSYGLFLPSFYETIVVAQIDTAKQEKKDASLIPGGGGGGTGSPSKATGTPPAATTSTTTSTTTSPATSPRAAPTSTSPATSFRAASPDPTSLSSPPTSLPGSPKTAPAKPTLKPAQRLDAMNTELDGIVPYDNVAVKLKSEMMSVITAASLKNAGQSVVTAIDNAMRPRLGFLTYKSFGQLVSELVPLVSNTAEFRPGVADAIRNDIESRDTYDDRILKLFEKINAILASTDAEIEQSTKIDMASMLASYGGSLPVDFERAILSRIENEKVAKAAEVPGSSSMPLLLSLFPSVDASKYTETVVKQAQDLQTVAGMLLEPGINQGYIDLAKSLYEAGINSLQTAKNPKNAVDGTYSESTLKTHLKNVREMMQRVVYVARYERALPEINAVLGDPKFSTIASQRYEGGTFKSEADKLGNGNSIPIQTVSKLVGTFVERASQQRLATGTDIDNILGVSETEKLFGFAKSIQMYPDGPYEQLLLDFVREAKQSLSGGASPSETTYVPVPAAVYNPMDKGTTQLLENLRNYEKILRSDDSWNGYFSNGEFQYLRFSEELLWPIVQDVMSPIKPNIKTMAHGWNLVIPVPPVGVLFESYGNPPFADGRTIADMGGMTSAGFITIGWEERMVGDTSKIADGILYIPAKNSADLSGVQIARSQLLSFLEAMKDIELSAIAEKNGQPSDSKMAGIIRAMAQEFNRDPTKSRTLYDLFKAQWSPTGGALVKSLIEESAAMDAEMTALTMYNDTAPVGPELTEELMKKPEVVRRLGTANVLFNITGRLRGFASAKEGEFGIYAKHTKEGKTIYNLETISRNLIRPVIYAYQEALVKLGENQIISSMSSDQGREMAATMSDTDLATVGYPIFDRLVPVNVQYHLGLIIHGMDYRSSPPKELVSVGRGLSDKTGSGWQKYIGNMTFEEKTAFFREWAKLARLIYLILKDIDITAADVAFAPVPAKKIFFAPARLPEKKMYVAPAPNVPFVPVPSKKMDVAPAASPIRYSPEAIAGLMESMFGPVDASVDDWATWE